MTRFVDFRSKNAAFLYILLGFTFQDAHCDLVVSPAGPTRVNAVAGNNVTLAVSFSGAPDPAVIWYMRDLPVVTWTITSPNPPDIPEDREKVLKIEPDGSLTFVNVPVDYSSNYTVEMTKSGLGKSSTSFTLKVFEHIQDVSLSVTPDFPMEGDERFTLQYSMLQGVVEQQQWFFNSVEVQTDSRYSVLERSLVILRPNRNDSGRYTVSLTNPYNSSTTPVNVTVLYGPDEPTLQAHPAQPFYVSGDSLSLSCQAEGFPRPTAEWAFGGQSLSNTRGGVLHLADVRTSQGGTYTCTLLNEKTRQRRRKNMTLNVYEKPSGGPTCSVRSVNNVDLRYHCSWLGGSPRAQLYFPALSNTSRGDGNLSLTVIASDSLNGKTVTCMADHPLEQSRCNATASSPARFLPAVRTAIDAEGKIVVTIRCVSEASPKALVSWSKGSEAVANGTTHQVSGDTATLNIRDHNVGSFLGQNYTCACRNPLGIQRREIQLRGPAISDSSLFPNQDGTIVTLTWEVPSSSVVTGNTIINSEKGFDIQMKGPDLMSKNRNGAQARSSSKGFRTIQQKPGSSRSADIFPLDPNLTYRFRVIPKARLTDGEPSEGHRIGPGDGLSGAAIAGIAAGIPCSLLFLLLLGGFIYLCVCCSRNKSRQTRYPVSRAVEKTITTQAAMTPHNLLAGGGLKSPPDYNRLQQTPSERSVALPSFVPPPPVRVATTV